MVLTKYGDDERDNDGMARSKRVVDVTISRARFGELFYLSLPPILIVDHGATENQKVIDSFIAECVSRGWHCVRVTSGPSVSDKGKRGGLHP